MKAPGEAEAACAALSRAGHVDGCVTLDGDALLFGAEVVYQTLKLEVLPVVLSVPPSVDYQQESFVHLGGNGPGNCMAPALQRICAVSILGVARAGVCVCTWGAQGVPAVVSSPAEGLPVTRAVVAACMCERGPCPSAFWHKG